jgi:D-alanyl-D-alanine dipeptidase
MRRFEVFTYSVIAVTAALVSSDANAAGPFVDIRSVDPTIVVELRYAGHNNFLGHPIYSPRTRALVRPEVAFALAKAQTFLRQYNYGVKIWDAYRPAAVQAQLWQASHNSDYVANPDVGVGSLHTWGVAVDATLVDSWNREVRMPSDFDDFTPAAMWRYLGPSSEIGGHVRLLQYAMYKAGFWGLRTEWWHFTIADWKKYVAPEKLKSAEQVAGTRWEGRL